MNNIKQDRARPRKVVFYGRVSTEHEAQISALDNQMEWYQELSVPSRRKIRRFLKRQGIKNGSVQDRLLEYTWRSKAEYAIVPLSDILGMGKEARLNTPGTVGSPNWEWKLENFFVFYEKLEALSKVLENTGRRSGI